MLSRINEPLYWSRRSDDEDFMPVHQARAIAVERAKDYGWTIYLLGVPAHLVDQYGPLPWEEFDAATATSFLSSVGWEVVERKYVEGRWSHHADGSRSAIVTLSASEPDLLLAEKVPSSGPQSHAGTVNYDRLDGAARAMGTNGGAALTAFFAYFQGETDSLPERPRDLAPEFSELGPLTTERMIDWFVAWYIGDVDVCPPRAATTEGS